MKKLAVIVSYKAVVEVPDFVTEENMTKAMEREVLDYSDGRYHFSAEMAHDGTARSVRGAIERACWAHREEEFSNIDWKQRNAAVAADIEGTAARVRVDDTVVKVRIATDDE